MSLVGKTLGSYRVIARLGEGGMGVVYLGEHETIGRKAAIKVLHPEFVAQPTVVQRFFNEARAANRVKHSGIVEVYDYGQSPTAGAYLVMEFLEGESLETRLRRRLALPPTEVVSIVRRLASALGATHASGIIHRDLKPDNIFLVPDSDHPTGERVKILDFGIAKLVDDGTRVGLRTRTGAVMGTPAYMSPEQCHGAKNIDHRTDIYALGVIAYEALCGRPPFEADGFGQLLAMHLNQKPPPLRSRTPGIPAPLAAAVLRALAKDPDERFASMAELASAIQKAIEEVRGDGPVAADLARPPGTLPLGVPTAAEASAAPSGPVPAPELATEADQETRRGPFVHQRDGTDAADVSSAGAPPRSGTALWAPGAAQSPPEHDEAPRRPSTLSGSAAELELPARRRWLVPTLAAAVVAGVVAVVAPLLWPGDELATELDLSAVNDAIGSRDWDTALALLEASGASGRETRELRTRAVEERENERHLERFVALVEEGKRIEALRAGEEVDRESVYWPEIEPRLNEIRREILKAALGEARAAIAVGEPAAARAAIDRAWSHARSEEEIAEVEALHATLANSGDAPSVDRAPIARAGKGPAAGRKAGKGARRSAKGKRSSKGTATSTAASPATVSPPSPIADGGTSEPRTTPKKRRTGLFD